MGQGSSSSSLDTPLEALITNFSEFKSRANEYTVNRGQLRTLASSNDLSLEPAGQQQVPSAYQIFIP